MTSFLAQAFSPLLRKCIYSHIRIKLNTSQLLLIHLTLGTLDYSTLLLLLPSGPMVPPTDTTNFPWLDIYT